MSRTPIIATLALVAALAPASVASARSGPPVAPVSTAPSWQPQDALVGTVQPSGKRSEDSLDEQQRRNELFASLLRQQRERHGFMLSIIAGVSG